jgi:hypothetical protein
MYSLEDYVLKEVELKNVTRNSKIKNKRKQQARSK